MKSEGSRSGIPGPSGGGAVRGPSDPVGSIASSSWLLSPERPAECDGVPGRRSSRDDAARSRLLTRILDLSSSPNGLDAQAAASVVRSLAKGHKPAGARACSSEDEPFTHLVIPDESRRTLKVIAVTLP